MEIVHYTEYYKSPIGHLEIRIINNELSEIKFIDFEKNIEDTPIQNNKTINNIFSQLDEYFSGNRKVFDLNLQLNGTDFQNKVWNNLSKIPYGETTSYINIASRINNPKASRAVGNANNKNHIPIVIPCHRVIGKNGKLVGYAGGLWRKEWLLEHERKNYS